MKTDYNLILKGKKEFYHKLNSKKYYVLKVDTFEKQNIMIKYIIKFIKKKDERYIGIDLEFNQVTKDFKDIALMQINLENSKNGHIYVFKPSELDTLKLNIIIKLLTHKYIIKILHGSESLDIPYLFNQLLITKSNVDNFCINFYDTKFLCEYYNIINNLEQSCSIYNLLYDQKIINKKQVKYMEKIEHDMGNIQDIIINIYDMNDNILKYALYDVLFLPELLKKLLNTSSQIIADITCIIFKYKRNIDTMFSELEKLINSQNNYFIYENNKKFTLHNVYEIFLYQYFNFNDLIELNYFKNFFTIIIKLIIYSTIYNHQDIYISNENKLKNINYNKYFIWLSTYKYITQLISKTRKEFYLNIY